jgi:hypothetical protein
MFLNEISVLGANFGWREIEGERGGVDDCGIPAGGQPQIELIGKKSLNIIRWLIVNN